MTKEQIKHLPVYNCRGTITLENSSQIQGIYDPAFGFMTTDGKCIWIERVIDFKEQVWKKNLSRKLK